MNTSINLCLCLAACLLAVSGAQIQCPKGWTAHSNSCYHFSHDVEDWRGAVYVCKLIGGYIAEIGTVDEQNFVLGIAKNVSYWIGLTDLVEEGIYHWMTSQDTLSATGYTNWALREPNNSGGEENCVSVDKRHGGPWNDNHCTDNNYYVCESNPGS